MTVDELEQCIAAANGDKRTIRDCERDFVRAGGSEGPKEDGKAFSDTDGGKVFVTEGGKVFGGKVF